MPNAPGRFSVTEVKIASLCGRLFLINKKYGRRVIGPGGSSIGSFVHKILELFAKKARESARFQEKLLEKDREQVAKIVEEALLELYQERIMDRIEKRSEEAIIKAWDVLQQAGKSLAEILAQFLKKYSPEMALRKMFFAVEWSFKVPIPALADEKSIMLSGRIDWLGMDPSEKQVMLWDFKTSSSADLEVDIPQIALYAFGVLHELRIPAQAALFYLKADSVKMEKLDTEKINVVQGHLFQLMYNMRRWYRDEEKALATIYRDFCGQCIQRRFCFEQFGPNPNFVDLKADSPISPPKDYPSTFIEPISELDADNIVAGDSSQVFPVQMRPTAPAPIQQGLLRVGQFVRTGDEFVLNPLVFARHGVLLGASGSGKTVLGKVLLEEALSLGYPCLVVDPQGDLCSLALPADKDGEKLVQSTEIKIYTPGSSKGIKMTIDPLLPPIPDVLADSEYLSILLDSTSTLILQIIGYSKRTLLSEKSLLEAIIKSAWEEGQHLAFKDLAQEVGEATEVRSVIDNSIVDVDALLSSAKQRTLAQKIMQLAVGTEGAYFVGGTSLDIHQLTKGGPKLHIINLASVGTDVNKRQLVVSWLLRQIYDWMLQNPQREQDQIRFFLYMDEVADFIPPHPYNPPSKKMLMLLMRQARKYGVSCLLATQSPATIDYKVIDNVASIFVGRVPSVQSIKKIQGLVEPYGPVVQRMVKKAQKTDPGDFLVIGAGHTRPEFIRVRWLHTRHETLSLDDVESLKHSTFKF